MSTPKVGTSIILHSARAKKGNKYPVKLRVSCKGIRYYYSTGISCTEQDFQFMMSDTPGLFKADRLKVIKLQEKADRIISDLDNQFNFNTFKDLFSGKPVQALAITTPKVKPLTLQEAFEAYIKELDNSNRIGTRNLYRTTLNSLIRFRGNLLLSCITAKYLKEYEIHMLVKEKISKSFTGICTRNLRTIFNRAIAESLISKEFYPFSQYKCMNGTGNKRSLSSDTVKLILNHQPIDNLQQKAKDFWLLSFLCNGMNMKDLLLAKNSQLKGSSLTFTRTKTEHTNAVPVVIELTPLSLNIITRYRNQDTEPTSYLFPILREDMQPVTVFERVKQFIKTTNLHFNNMLKNLEITDRITTYAARHSFASLSLQAGVSIYDIGQGMGHSSITTTQRYIASLDVNKRKENTGKLLSFIS